MGERGLTTVFDDAIVPLMLLTKGRRKFIADVAKSLLTVGFAGAFAAGFFAEVPGPWKYVLVAGILVVLVIGFLASTE